MCRLFVTSYHCHLFSLPLFETRLPHSWNIWEWTPLSEGIWSVIPFHWTVKVFSRSQVLSLPAVEIQFNIFGDATSFKALIVSIISIIPHTTQRHPPAPPAPPRDTIKSSRYVCTILSKVLLIFISCAAPHTDRNKNREHYVVKCQVCAINIGHSTDRIGEFH